MQRVTEEEAGNGEAAGNRGHSLEWARGLGLPAPPCPGPATVSPVPGRPESPTLVLGHRLAGNLGSPFKQGQTPLPTPLQTSSGPRLTLLLGASGMALPFLRVEERLQRGHQTQGVAFYPLIVHSQIQALQTLGLVQTPHTF